MDYRFEICPGLPQLAWVCLVGKSGAVVYHGSSVEVGSSWIVEGAWDGDFGAGDFHISENFFGSGVRFDRESVHFVPSSALVDRLVYAERGDNLIVSNSLPLLLAYTGDHLDPAHDYRQESNASLAGIDDYERAFATSASGYGQLVFETLTVGAARRFWKRPVGPAMNTFADYEVRLKSALAALAENYTDPRRRKPMVGITTVSSGYDSAAVASLVRDIGVRRCFTSAKSNSILPRWLNPTAVDDSGAPVADALGLEWHLLKPDEPPPEDDELYFLAGTCAGQESLFHALASSVEATGLAAVFTGYHGDKVWDVGLPDEYLGDTILRGDSSGIGLSEIRLKVGFINVAVPFIFARQVADLVRISRSEDMAPWRLGGSYDRPIPRRLAESAGVPRETFGQRKRAVWEHRYLPRSRRIETMVFDQMGVDARRARAAARRRSAEFVASIVVGRARRLSPRLPRLTPHAGDEINLASLCFIGANEILSERYRRALPPRL